MLFLIAFNVVGHAYTVFGFNSWREMLFLECEFLL